MVPFFLKLLGWRLFLMKSDTATALSWLTVVPKAYQLFQPKGTPLVQATLGTISAFSSAKLSSTVRQSVPKPTKTVGEEMLVPDTAPCGRTSQVAVEEVAPPYTFIVFSLLLAPTK